MIVLTMSQTSYVAEDLKFPVMAISMEGKFPCTAAFVPDRESLMVLVEIMLFDTHRSVVITSLTGYDPRA